MSDGKERRPPPALHDNNALFLDVDGTLVAFADRPDQVHLPPQVRESLTRLQQRLGGALALVSGRPLHQIDELFAPLLLPAAGLHGLQVRSSADAQAAMPEDTSPWLHDLHQRAQQLAHAHPGLFVEEKGQGLALHWRTAPDSAQTATEFAHAQLQHLPGYRLQPGNHVIEFVREGCDKGSALQTLMGKPPFAGRQPVFVGDDLTDESGFAAVRNAAGWGVLVGERADSHAEYSLPDIHAVHTWLEVNSR